MTATLDDVATRTRHRPLWPAYVSGSLSSVGGVFLTVGIFFFTEHYFHWGLGRNFALASAQGTAYVLGSLSADKVARKFGRRGGLMRIYLVLAALALLAGIAAHWPALLVANLLAYVFTLALTWPQLESLVSSDADAHEMSRRVGMYNLVWSGTNAIAFAVNGAIIEHWRGGVFVIPAIAYLTCAMLMWRNRAIEPATATQSNLGHVEPEPELLAKRTLAMWLARISLPSTYVVVYGLAAMMPLLPVMHPLDTAQRTLAGSVWMIARFVAFLYLGATAWWHTRPRVLLGAAAMMLIAFMGVTIRPSDIFGAQALPYSIDLASMLTWQVALGAMMGLIYSASLYFGMVLSEGSTEHGGYHEALIGLGSILGPGTAALTQLRWHGEIRAGVAAVCAVIGLSVVAATIATLKTSRKPTS